MEIKDYKLSLYESISNLDNKLIDLDSYVGMVMHGRNQDAVIAARTAKSNEDTDLYKKIKNASMMVTPTGLFDSGKTKTKENLQPNGLVCIDIDTDLTKEQEHQLWNDQYTLIIHRSFGGDGWCIFVRINPDKIHDAYDSISKYYYDKYNVRTDLACKNSNRLRFLSFDPDIHVNPKAKLFNVKVEKKDVAPKQVSYIYTKSDFDNILDQIRDKAIDLCQEDYYRYIRIGLSLASEFGESGRDTFHFVCSYGSKYNQRATDRDFNGFIQNRNGDKTTIGTFYYYAKEAGIDIYSERTRTIINRVSVAKAQGSPTVDSVVYNLESANSITATDDDKELIKKLIDSKTDFSKLANSDLTEIEQLANFIVDAFNPSYDEIVQTKYINSKRLEDRDIEDIYIACKKNFDFNVNKADVNSVLNSSYVKRTNILKDFIRENAHLTPEGYIEQYASFIHPQTEYNKWAFKKWLVGAMHNWFCDFEHREASPLTLVLTGKDHGVGKTSFFRNLMPEELSKYMVQSKLSIKDSDSMLRMGKSLIILDDEFGGKAFKDDKEFKDISDQTHITLRVKYGREDTMFRRRASLAGTSNELDVLKDSTGNRRILPILVKSTDYESMVSFDKTSLIMEAYNLYKSGFEWRIYSQEEKDYIKDNTQQNQAVLAFEEVFFMYFSLERTSKHPIESVMNQGEVLQYLNIHSGLKPTKFDIAEVFKKNNMEYKSYRLSDRVKNGVKLYLAGTNNNPDTFPF